MLIVFSESKNPFYIFILLSVPLVDSERLACYGEIWSDTTNRTYRTMQQYTEFRWHMTDELLLMLRSRRMAQTPTACEIHSGPLVPESRFPRSISLGATNTAIQWSRDKSKDWNIFCSWCFISKKCLYSIVHAWQSLQPCIMIVTNYKCGMAQS